MSFPILPAILSAFFLAGGTGAAVAAASSDAPAKASSERAGKPEGKRDKAMGLCAHIECTPEQKAEIRELRERFVQERTAARDELRARMLEVLSDEQRAALAEREAAREAKRAEKGASGGHGKAHGKAKADGRGKAKGKADGKGKGNAGGKAQGGKAQGGKAQGGGEGLAKGKAPARG